MDYIFAPFGLRNYQRCESIQAFRKLKREITHIINSTKRESRQFRYVKRREVEKRYVKRRFVI